MKDIVVCDSGKFLQDVVDTVDRRCCGEAAANVHSSYANLLVVERPGFVPRCGFYRWGNGV